MPISIFTGAPRCGKSLRAVREIRSAVREGRPVYSNIKGMALAGVDALPADWRECCDGALIVIDEVHEKWPSTGKSGRTADEQVVQLDQHGHRGFDFILITQWPMKVHFQVREHTSVHVHFMRPFGLPACTMYEWNHWVDDPDDRMMRDQANKRFWLYDRSLYPLYKSATLHTVRTRVPSKLKFAALAAGVLGYFVYSGLTSGEGLMVAKLVGVDSSLSSVPEPGVLDRALKGGGEPLRVVASDGLNDWTAAAPLPAIGGCIANARHCRCYSAAGAVLDLTDFDCRLALDRPLPLPIQFGGGATSPPPVASSAKPD